MFAHINLPDYTESLEMTMPGLVHCYLEWPKMPTQQVPLSACPTQPLVTQNTSKALQSTLMHSPKLVTTVTMPAEIGPNHHWSLQCSGAGGNVMPLCIFAKLFPRHITTDSKPTRLHPCDTRLTVYNRSNIPQFGALDTAIEWTPKGHHCSKHLQTRWYVADSPGSAIIGLLSSPKLEFIQLNYAVKLTSRCNPPSPPQETYNRMC